MGGWVGWRESEWGGGWVRERVGGWVVEGVD